MVDNTFATPYLQTPLALGADVVVHSTTKYLGGHSDVIGGFVSCNDDDLAGSIGLVQRAAGAVPGPFDCFLVLRGVKTLAVRMDRHCLNAEAVVEVLEGHPGRRRRALSRPAVAPGPRGGGRPDAALRRHGGVHVSGGATAAKDFVERTRLFTLGESLGGVESLVGYPTTMSHAAMAGMPEAIDPAWYGSRWGSRT